MNQNLGKLVKNKNSSLENSSQVQKINPAKTSANFVTLLYYQQNYFIANYEKL